MSDPTLALVVCGWHFRADDLLARLARAASGSSAEVSCYVASHRSKEAIPEELRAGIERLGWQIVYFPNEGWDWGAYQQFVSWQHGRDEASDYYLFLHDDVELLDEGLIDALLEKARAGAEVVGNGTPMYPDRMHPGRYPEDVLWAEANGLEIRSQRWHVVRGSCVFMTRRAAHEVLLRMPIKQGRAIELANASLRVFAALATDAFGPEGIAYLGDAPRSSAWLREEMRGSQGLSLKRRLWAALPEAVRRRIKRLRGMEKVPPVPEGTGLKVNLGSGVTNLPGYLNVDLHSPIADLKADIVELEFPEGSVAEVLMVHAIEHIEVDALPGLFAKLFRWLRDDGQLILEFPDLIKCCRLVLDMRNDPEKIHTSPFGAQGLYGGGPKRTIGDLHKWGWTHGMLEPLLREAGFRHVLEERARFHQPKRDTRVVAVK